MEQSVAAPSFIFLIFFGLIGILGFALWLWSLIACIRNRYLNDNNRLIGILLIVFLNLLGSFVYLFLPREGELQR